MVERNDVAKIIWETSRADEGAISATGANHVADALMPLLARAWDEGHAAANGYDLSEPLDYEEWSDLLAPTENPYREA